MALKINNYGDPVITGYSEYATGNIECPVIKYDQCSGNSTMDIIRNFNFANLETGTDISIDNSNNIYLAGETYISALGYYSDILYGKYNSNLSRVFLNSYGGLWTQFPKKIKLDAQENIYIGGTNEQSTRSYEFLLVKFNNNGVLQWARTYNNGISTQDHIFEDMVIDPNGYIYVTGGSWGSVTGFDIATIKYDLNGTVIWTNRYNGNVNGVDRPQSNSFRCIGECLCWRCIYGRRKSLIRCSFSKYFYHNKI